MNATPHRRPETFRAVAAVILLIGSAALPAAAQDRGAPTAPPPAAANGNGRIVEAPRNIRSFRPAESATIVDPASINLAALFEALGEDATLWYQHVLTLSNPWFEGRSPDTAGGQRAAEYLEFHYRLAGLEPAFPSGEEVLGNGHGEALSYRQPFDFESPSPEATLRRVAVAIAGELLPADQVAALGVSANGAITAPISFVGYAIEEGPEETEYSSFDEQTDLEGRIALMLRYEPLEEDGTSQWSEGRFSRHASMARKLRAVAERNPAGVILVNPPGAEDGATGLEPLSSSVRFGRAMDVPVVQLTPEAADRVLRAADPEGRDLMAWRRLADTGAVGTVDLSDTVRVSLETELDIERRLATENVGAVLAGRGDLASKWVVLGAHFDHVGYGYAGARPDNRGKLHPGADDNASGTAALLILARRLAKQYAEAGDGEALRSVLFLSFGAEEAGLHGSRHFVANAPIPAESISVMINMDMIGRLRADTLSVGGTGTAEEFDELLRPILLDSGLTISESRGGRGPSDHSNFFGAGVPVLFLFTGLHDRYHTPEDYGYTVNPAGAIEIVDLVEQIALTIAAEPQQLTFINEPGDARRGGPMQVSVRLGVTPGYGAEVEGVLVEAVAEGTAAADAGMEAGDVIIAWDMHPIEGPGDLMSHLRDASPGDQARLRVLRDGQEVMLLVTLKARDE